MRCASFAVLFLACQGPGWSTSAAFGTTLPPQTTGASAGSTGGSSGSTGHAPEDSSAGDNSPGSTSLALDVGSQSDLGGAGPPGCRGKIDFLFVVSRGGVMGQMLAELVEVYPAFIETIQTKFADFDYHIMVIDGDADWGLSYCNSECPGPFDMCGVPEYPCAYLPQITDCDNALGAGTIFNAGGLAPNKPCTVASGKRWIDKTQPNLAETFTCLAQVGESGRDWLGAALTAAMSPELNAPGGCNEGFLRDDALLMVSFLSSTVDDVSPGAPKDWAKAVRDAKHGDVDSVIMFSLLDPDCPKQDRICDLLEGYFPNHYIADRFTDDFTQAFDTATDLVEAVCSGVVPD